MNERERDPHAIKAMEPADVVEEYRTLVGSIVARLRRKLHIRISAQDIENYAFEGLLDAHARFDPEAGAIFASFAYYRIRGAIMDGCRKEGWMTRDRARQARREEIIDEYMEDAAETARSVPPASSFEEALNRVSAMANDAAMIFMLNEADFDLLETHNEEQHRRLEKRVDLALLQGAMAILTDEEREVVTRHHMEGERMDDIAAEFGHSRSWVSRVNTRALERMREYFFENE